MQWELETGGTLGAGSEQTPCVYPRPDEARDSSKAEDNESKQGETVLDDY